MIARAWMTVLWVGLVFLLSPASARSSGDPRVLHPGPPINFEFEIEEGRVGILLISEQATFNPWIGVLQDRFLEAPLPTEKVEPYQTGVKEFFAENNAFFLNGEQIRPEVTEVRLEPSFASDDDPALLAIEMEVTCEGWPKSVGLRWDTWERTAGVEGDRIPILYRWPVGEFVFSSIEPKEPESTWHALPGLGQLRQAPSFTEMAPPKDTLPWLPTLIVAFLILSLPLLRKLTIPIPVILGVWAVGLTCAWKFKDQSIEALWQRVQRPNEQEALAMFETLHGNIYQAFAARNEDNVYELLSRTVAPKILDSLYGEVYESMILRGEGGAVCDVQRIEVQERSVELPEDRTQLSFEADWTWQVHGLVSHYGHKHERTNQYHARYLVEHDGASWKISDVEILNYERLEDFGG